jgi:hypothetical protein
VTHTYYLTRQHPDGSEQEIEVRYSYSRGEPMTRNHPGTGPEVVVEETWCDGQVVELELDQAELYEIAMAHEPDYEQCRADYLYDVRRDR